jgi:hypothetical protein
VYAEAKRKVRDHVRRQGEQKQVVAPRTDRSFFACLGNNRGSVGRPEPDLVHQFPVWVKRPQHGGIPKRTGLRALA